MAQKVEIQVIEDKLLLEGVLDEKLVKENDLSRINGEFNLVELAPTVQSLSLSFKRIGRIENLVGFDNLVKLCLDNNFIEEINNIGHLVNLKWLDLSFNKIKKIQGLETLTQLEDLSLYSNKISIIEGLEKCTNLQCLSLGNNRIDSLEQIIRFRQLKSLRMLTLSDNPISNNNVDYRNYVMAYVDTIKYLD
jgi:Leucine-rich repeat (LRR) protein